MGELWPALSLSLDRECRCGTRRIPSGWPLGVSWAPIFPEGMLIPLGRKTRYSLIGWSQHIAGIGIERWSLSYTTPPGAPLSPAHRPALPALALLPSTSSSPRWTKLTPARHQHRHSDPLPPDHGSAPTDQRAAGHAIAAPWPMSASTRHPVRGSGISGVGVAVRRQHAIGSR
jgi:hypothetical protein